MGLDEPPLFTTGLRVRGYDNRLSTIASEFAFPAESFCSEFLQVAYEHLKIKPVNFKDGVLIQVC
jgi:hypothetical protein